MANLGICYQQGIGVEPDPAQAVDWYHKGAAAGDASASSRLRTLQTAEMLVSGVRTGDVGAKHWAQRVAVGLNTGEWQDDPLVLRGWQDLSAGDAVSILAHLHAQLLAFGLDDELSALHIQRLRGTDLAFYPNCRLLDVQLKRPGLDSPLLSSALVSPRGAALLDGTSPLLHAINPRLLRLADDEAASGYLRFFCAFVRSQEGPFQIIDMADDLPLVSPNAAAVADGFLSPIKPLQALDGYLESDGWRRFEGCVLYGNGLFRSTFKVHGTGMVEMKTNEIIAADLPIRTRRYDGIFRTPLLAPGEE
jgi:hypothetical protein